MRPVLAAPDTLAGRLDVIRSRIEGTARRVGRDPADIRLVAVTKTLSPETLAAALAAGVVDVGENYVQEAREKRRAVGGAGVWHLIGGLQRNKARAAAELFDWVHSLDSAPLAEALAREADRLGRRLRVLIQVNVAEEATKRGIATSEVDRLGRAVLALGSLDLQGLMTIAPASDDPEAARPHFRALREVRKQAQNRLGVELPHLSMGMSGDFVIAVEEGATILRLGRALFGPRAPRSWREGS
jgi:hypothetical protein